MNELTDHNCGIGVCPCALTLCNLFRRLKGVNFALFLHGLLIKDMTNKLLPIQKSSLTVHIYDTATWCDLPEPSLFDGTSLHACY